MWPFKKKPAPKPKVSFTIKPPREKVREFLRLWDAIEPKNELSKFDFWDYCNDIVSEDPKTKELDWTSYRVNLNFEAYYPKIEVTEP